MRKAEDRIFRSILGLLTLGIYPVVIWSRIVTEVNIVASRYDGKKTTHYCLMLFVFSWLTFGIAPLRLGT